MVACWVLCLAVWSDMRWAEQLAVLLVEMLVALWAVEMVVELVEQMV